MRGGTVEGALHPPSAWYAAAGVQLSNAHDVILDGVTARGNGGSGFYIATNGGTTSNITLNDCIATQNGPPSNATWAGAGVLFAGTAPPDTVVINNLTSSENSVAGIVLYTGTHVMLSSTTIANNALGGLIVDPAGGQGLSVVVDGGTISTPMGTSYPALGFVINLDGAGQSAVFDSVELTGGVTLSGPAPLIWAPLGPLNGVAPGRDQVLLTNVDMPVLAPSSNGAPWIDMLASDSSVNAPTNGRYQLAEIFAADPNGQLYAPLGSTYASGPSSGPTVWTKTSDGTSNTGWVLPALGDP
jgi:hypothetical protein